MGSWDWAYKYSSSNDRLNDDGWGTSVKSVCNDIKNRAEDLKDCADKIREICNDLDTGSKLVVNGQTYGQYIIEIADELDDKYTSLCSQCDTILADARSRRSNEDYWGSEYNKEQKALKDKN